MLIELEALLFCKRLVFGPASQSERFSERGKRPLGGVGLGSLEGDSRLDLPIIC